MSGTVADVFEMPVLFVGRGVGFLADLKKGEANRQLSRHAVPSPSHFWLPPD